MAHQTPHKRGGQYAPSEGVNITVIGTPTRGVLNWHSVQYLLSIIDQQEVLGDFSLRNFTRDVFTYLTVASVKRQINEVIEKSFDGSPCVVVGHSLGSIIGYLVLRHNPVFQVKKFITLGSPLGLRAVQKYLDAPIIPSCIDGEWYNAYDEGDYVALNPLNNLYFPTRPPIRNYNGVKNHTKNRHGIDGYLDDAVVAREIWEKVQPLAY